MKNYILAIDQGTTGTNASLTNSKGEVIARVDQDFPQIYPKPGWVEHSPEDIWGTVKKTVTEVISEAGITATDIAAIGITNQRETVMVWDRQTHTPIYNAIVWQCRRTSEFCQKLKKKTGVEKTVRKKTGLVIDAYFSGSKIRWMMDHVPGARARAQKGELAAGTVDTFLLWRLTGGKTHQTDVSNASRTMLMNIDKGVWDLELCKLLGVPTALLPDIRPSSGLFGKTEGLGFLPDGIPITGIAGDQQSALFGQACFSVGEAKCTFGTGSFILLNTGKKMVASKAGCLTTVAWKLSEKESMVYALEGGAFICGAAVQWLRDEMKFFKSSHDIEALAKSVQDAGGVEFVPALTGLGAPHWDQDARGLICGLTRGSTPAHIARATLEAMALQNADILEAMAKDLGKKMKVLKVDGGASSNNLLMQMQTDYLGCELIRPQNVETTSQGAVFLAGLGVGMWKSTEEIQKIWATERKFEPEMKSSARSERFKKWNRAVQRALT
jgi:glycerol kinase